MRLLLAVTLVDLAREEAGNLTSDCYNPQLQSTTKGALKVGSVSIWDSQQTTFASDRFTDSVGSNVLRFKVADGLLSLIWRH